MSTPVSSSSQPMQPWQVTYFHGKITREQAEDLLLHYGAAEGLFLLRESVHGNFAVSICHKGRVHHYNVERQADGTYQIPTGKKFVSPVELVHHHSAHLDGFLTLARIPLDRLPGESPLVLHGISSQDLEDAIRHKAIEMGYKGQALDEALGGPMRNRLQQHVLREMHMRHPWYHDDIKRTDAERRLLEGPVPVPDGKFLVRYKKEDNTYALSLSHKNDAKHYRIERRGSKLSIEGGKCFDSLVEMIDHYHFRQDGLLCKLKIPVECPGFKKSKQGSNASSRSSLNGGTSSPVVMCGAGSGSSTNTITTSTASGTNGQAAAGSTCTVGRPLPPPPSHSQSASISSTTSTTTPVAPPPPSHAHSSSATAFPSAPPGPSQTDLISFADWPNVDSLLTTNQSSNPSQALQPFNPQAGPPQNPQQVAWPPTSFPPLQAPLGSVSSVGGTVSVPSAFMSPSGPTPSSTSAFLPFRPSSASAVPLPSSHHASAFSRPGSQPNPPSGSNQPQPSQHLLDIPPESLNMSPIVEQPWNEPDGSEEHSAPGFSDFFAEEAQTVYDALPVSEVTFNLRPEQLYIKEKLGGGNFGHVLKAMYRAVDGKEVQVAVKTLKQGQTMAAEEEILTEARNMSALTHRHIVRLIGVCKADTVMLVLELAPLGPVNKYLKRHPETAVFSLAEWMYQVSQGMAYLESCKFVHRDLAARNVLLASPSFAKISDFGMSKALHHDNDYYKAATAGRWPLKWYAPECINYYKFDSKSDVWSFGVVLWEVFSYGERPYRDLTGVQILQMLESGRRLSRPMRCPEFVFDVMMRCWSYHGFERPTFAELVLTMSRVVQRMKSTGT